MSGLALLLAAVCLNSTCPNSTRENVNYNEMTIQVLTGNGGVGKVK